MNKHIEKAIELVKNFNSFIDSKAAESEAKVERIKLHQQKKYLKETK